MASILPFDELNRFTVDLRERFPDGTIATSVDDFEDILDMMFDLFSYSFFYGSGITGKSLGSTWKPSDKMRDEVVNKKVAGKTWRERAEEYFLNGGTVDDLVRIVETETHRDANEAALTTAKRVGAKTKTWITMMDDRVREAHQPLQSVTVPIDDVFVTWDGYETQAPGMFGVPELDINCRCELVFN